MKTLVESANKFLDEDIDSNEIGKCKDCIYWSKDYESECDLVGHNDTLEDDKSFVLKYEADDDQGLYGMLLTGPNFGCIQFKGK